MTLQEAEFAVHEFKKVTVIQSAEVVPNIDGDYSVLVTAIFRDSSIAAKALGIARAEEDFGNMAYATLGESNVPVLCSRETWQAWRDANPGGKIVKREQSGDVVTEIIFTAVRRSLIQRTARPSYGRFALTIRKPAGALALELSQFWRKGFFSRNDQRAALWEVTMGIAPVKGRLRHLVKVGQLDPPVISNWRQIKGLARSNDDAETEHLQRSSECECEPTLGGSSLAARSTHHRLQREPPGGRRPPPGGLKQRETQKLRSPLIPTLEACRRGRNLRVSYKDPAKHREALRKACHRYYRSYRENLNASV